MGLSDFQEDRDIERSIFSWPVILIVGTLVFVALAGAWRTFDIDLALRREIKDLEKKIAEAEASRQNYEKRLAELGTPEGIDRDARGRFNLKRPGEEVVIFLGEATSASPEGFARKWILDFWRAARTRIGF